MSAPIPTSQLSELALEKPIKCGWLKVKLTPNTWKKRWMVLRSTSVSMYKDNSEYSSWIVINLSDIMSINKLNTKKRMILVIVTTKKTYFLDPCDAQERELWEEEIKKVAPQQVRYHSDYTSSDWSSENDHSEREEDDQVTEQKTLFAGPISQKKKGLIVKKYHAVCRPKAMYWYKDVTEYQPLKVIYWRNVLDIHLTDGKRDELVIVTSQKRYKINIEEKDSNLWLKHTNDAQKSIKEQEGLWEDRK